MADAGLVIVWEQAKTGREARAMELFNSTMAYYTQERERGNVSSFEPVLLGSRGNGIGGWILVRGSGDQIDALRRSDDFRNFTVQANYVLDGFSVVDARLGDDLMKIMGEWGALVAKG